MWCMSCDLHVGNMHYHGQGVEEDWKMAVDYFQKGCELGEWNLTIIG